MENNKDKIVNNSNDKSVFTKEVELLSPSKAFFISLGEGCLKFALWLLDFVLSIVLSLGQFFLTIFLGTYKGILKIGKFFKRKAHQFKYNDIYGRISFGVFGVSSFKHGQRINGILYFLFEVAYIVLFVLFGITSISYLKDLKTPYPTRVDVDIFGNKTEVYGNSIIILITGLLWILSIILFLFVWNRSINAGHNLYKIKNYKSFDKVTKDNFEFSKELSEKAIHAKEEGISKSAFKKLIKNKIDEYLATIELSDKYEADKYRKDYSKYLINETINTAYEFSANKIKLVKKVEMLEATKDALIEVRAKNLEELVASGAKESKIEGFKNATLKKVSNSELKITKVYKKIANLEKQYTFFAELENTHNHKKYGKFNEYFDKISKWDLEITFYKNYSTFVNIYENSLGKTDEQNNINKEKGNELAFSTNAKTEAINAKYDAQLARRSEIEQQIIYLRHDYNKKVLEIKANGNNQEQLLEAKTYLIKETTRLNRSLNELPLPRAIKEMRKEEIKETRHAYNRDRRHLRTNFTPDAYARQCVIDYMLVELKFEYKVAIGFSKIVQRNILDGASVDHEAKIAEIEAIKAQYIADHEDKFVGRPTTFVEQLKGLLNQNFHITILTLPLLGIGLFTIVPLIFSILIAFTNYDYAHRPPQFNFEWIGFENFVQIFAPTNLKYQLLPSALLMTLSWTLIWAVCATFSNYILGIVVALMINKDSIKFKKLWRTVFVMTIAIPQFISLLGISLLLKTNGPIDNLVKFLTGSPLNFALNEESVNITKVIIILVNIWVGIPYTILSTTGILLNIPKDLYESSRVDGAGAFKQFTKITMPYILFVTGPYLITQFVGNINNFGVIFFLTGGNPQLGGGNTLPIGHTDLLITFLYDMITGGQNADMGIASTVGILIFIICSFFSIIMYNKTGSVQQEDQFQ